MTLELQREIEIFVDTKDPDLKMRDPKSYQMICNYLLEEMTLMRKLIEPSAGEGES